MKSWIKASVAALALLAAFAVSAQQPVRPYRVKPPFPQVELPEKARGERAIQLLGSRLNEVAEWYGKTPAEFAAILRRDRTAIIDRKGRLLYQEEIDPPTGTAPTLTSTGNLASLDQTFKLHSKPGSKRTIYLNFVGATLTNTVWNDSTHPSITALPFDLDGYPYTFSTTELERIQYMWQRVAEDYAPFDVDVTTEAPAAGVITRSGSSDDVYGTMVLITQRTFYSCSCGGVAYIGAFDDTTDFYKPALVFYDRLGAGNEKYVAEAISHEAGHNMGLQHMGTSTSSYYQGANGWAPIMGTGYYQNLVQWSRGEYPDANNREDEYTVMAGNGLALRADDHGNTTATATRMASSTANGVTTVYGSGIVNSSTDIDVFSFVAGAGAVSLQVNPANRSPNLDVGVQLRDSAGNVLATVTPTDSMSATINVSVAGGTYYVLVYATGVGTWSTGYGTYGSVGEFSILGTVPAAAAQPPVAALTATPTSGTAPLVVNFNGTGSFDPDGTIASYVWNFGDGTSGTGATASRTYTVPGIYTATLMVTDNAGLTNSKTVTIAVQNATAVAPVAAVTATPASGPVALPVSFSSTGSYDPDGSIASYEWNFGDGTALATTANVNHTYTTPGTYTATLKVTDNTGLSNSRSVTITANPTTTVTTSTQMSVTDVTVSLSTNKGGQTQAMAYVTVKDGSGKAVGGATVNGAWSGAITASGSGTTGTTGVAAVTSGRSKSGGTFIFTVNSVTLNGYTYVSSGTTSGSASR